MEPGPRPLNSVARDWVGDPKTIGPVDSGNSGGSDAPRADSWPSSTSGCSSSGPQPARGDSAITTTQLRVRIRMRAPGEKGGYVERALSNACAWPGQLW